MNLWTVSDVPSQRGRTAVVTGTGGLGFQAALVLARAGAKVIIAGRNPTKGLQAVELINSTVHNADIAFETMDLADLNSVSAFAEHLRRTHHRLDLLINNAAVMNPPKRLTTADGFELQLGTNYLGHFALTARLLPLLLEGNEPRVVTLSSIAARAGAVNFDDLHSQREYYPMRAYAQSKLACLMFAFELQRRSEAAGWGIRSIAAHPGISRTELLPNGSGKWSSAGLARRLLWFLFQPAAQGALPTLFAATSAQAQGGGYYGPAKFGETRGSLARAKLPAQALDRTAALKLWLISETLTGVTFSSGERERVVRIGGRASLGGR